MDAVIFEAENIEDMINLSEYILNLEILLKQRSSVSNSRFKALCRPHLDGQPGAIIRKTTSIEKRRDSGMFFTGTKLANKLASKLLNQETSKAVYYDPTCGTGELLLALARKLPIQKTGKETINEWGKYLAGTDLFADLVTLTKYRLCLLAYSLCGDTYAGTLNISSTFPKIKTGDSLNFLRLPNNCREIALNPPYSLMDSPSICKWGEGQVNAAAIFLENILKKVKTGTRILAILPDVLRSGRRYARWRDEIENHAAIHEIDLYGLFDRWTDVDVFLLDLKVSGKETRGNNKSSWIPNNPCKMGNVSHLFDVHVGAVVPHRDSDEGELYRYIHARSLPAWGIRSQIAEKRRFTGTVFTPPFVVVRRTSRPGQKRRAVATTILGKGDVAVENHLIVCLPKDGSKEQCAELMKRLDDDRTDVWLDKIIRCRHLTVSAVKEIPWIGVRR